MSISRNNWIEMSRLLGEHPHRKCSRKNENMSECMCVSPEKEISVSPVLHATRIFISSSLSLFVSFRSRFSSSRDQRANMIFLSFSHRRSPQRDTRTHYGDRSTQRLNEKKTSERVRGSG